jgi:hypothetical protein
MYMKDDRKRLPMVVHAFKQWSRGKIDKTFHDGWMDGWVESGRSSTHFIQNYNIIWIGRTSVA